MSIFSFPEPNQKKDHLDQTTAQRLYQPHLSNNSHELLYFDVPMKKCQTKQPKD